ncbi:hypothetical protein [Sphingomonas sp. 3-13AW]|uniref:hypothetical protein n=1 Tax=Sphingomonas sp. 3-13AW TaxID=3050450 RepID=UPI003BB7867C
METSALTVEVAACIVRDALVLIEAVDFVAGRPDQGSLKVKTDVGEFTVAVAVDGAEVGPPLSEQHSGVWGQHPDYAVSDWQYEVSNCDTRLGYWDWVAGQISLAG